MAGQASVEQRWGLRGWLPAPRPAVTPLDLEKWFTANPDLRVSGDTATLSNAPVSCNAAVPSIPGTTTVNDYTLTTRDGHHATLSSSGTLAENTETCTFTITGSATK